VAYLSDGASSLFRDTPIGRKISIQAPSSHPWYVELLAPWYAELIHQQFKHISAFLDGKSALSARVALERLGFMAQSLQQHSREEAGEDQDASISETHLNPGSCGHPEMCKRPCLYFPSGLCWNSRNCNFCHLPHRKRAVRLDKNLRNRLDDMTYPDRAALILPILQEKAHGAGGLQTLEQLQRSIGLEYPRLARLFSATGGGRCLMSSCEQAKEKRLRNALGAHSFRKLASLLRPPGNSTIQCAFATMMEHLHASDLLDEHAGA
jgi:hypothetical protein